MGAILQYWFSRVSEEQKNQQTLRTQAYVDYIRGAAGLAIAQKKGDTKTQQEYGIPMADARARILIYGSEPVIQSLAKFYHQGGVLDTPERKELFISMCLNMRKDSLSSNDASTSCREASTPLFLHDVETSEKGLK
ncbi:MAG: hypothetical protein AB1611_16500 [bacterium]